jgi:hypothetical protein
MLFYIWGSVNKKSTFAMVKTFQNGEFLFFSPPWGGGKCKQYHVFK